MTHSSRTARPAAIFAWDGTLVDSQRLIIETMRQVTSEILGSRFPSSMEELRMMMPMSAPEVFGMMSSDQSTVALLDRRYADVYLARRAELLVAYPGVAELLGTLREEGYLIGVVTPKDGTRVLGDARHLGLADLIDRFATADSLGERNPHPAPLELLIGEFQTSPARTVVVADGPHNIGAARAIGVATIGALYGNFAEADVRGAQPAALALTSKDVLDLVRAWRIESELDVQHH